MPCGCSLRPKRHYQRLVDGVFPLDPSEGIVSNNMSKLSFFTLQTPSKLPQVGKYLSKRLSREVEKRRIGYIAVAMKAIDSLVQSCHGYLNLFVESYLLMVETLLENSDPELQVIGTDSFLKFAYIKEEDTPSYYRRYDFFVSKFSSMCLNNSSVASDRTKIRLAGLRGLSALFVKTIDNLHGNIWGDVDKIVPAVLFNLRDEKLAQRQRTSFGGFGVRSASVSNPSGSGTGLITVTSTTSMSALDSKFLLEEQNPTLLAQSCLSELVSRANFTNMKAILIPILAFLDTTDGWAPNWFAMECFRVVMFSIQSQFFYIPITELLGHLDRTFSLQQQTFYLQAQQQQSSAGPSSPPSFILVKTGIVQVLSAIIQAAKGACGPSVLQCFNALLRQLRFSVDILNALMDERVAGSAARRSEEHKYQEIVIDTIGVFADNLPDYQKMDVMMFIADKLSSDANTANREIIQRLMLKALLRVSKAYAQHSTSQEHTFPTTLFDPLLGISVAADVEIRLLVQQIFQVLLARTPAARSSSPGAAQIASTAVVASSSVLTTPVAVVLTKDSLSLRNLTEVEARFLRKLHFSMYEHYILGSNTAMHFQALYNTHATLLREFGYYEMLDMLRLLFALQSYTDEQNEWSQNHSGVVHAFIAALFKLSARLSRNRPLFKYILKILENRSTAGFPLPPIEFEDDSSANLDFLNESGPSSVVFTSSKSERSDSPSPLSGSVQLAPIVESDAERSVHASATAVAPATPVSSDSPLDASSSIDPKILEARRAAQKAAIEYLTVAQEMDEDEARKEILGEGAAELNASSAASAAAADGKKHAQFSDKVTIMSQDSSESLTKSTQSLPRSQSNARATFVLELEVNDDAVLFDLETVISLLKNDPVIEAHIPGVAELVSEPYKHENVAAASVTTVSVPKIRKSVIPKAAILATNARPAIEQPRGNSVDVSAKTFKRILLSAPPPQHAKQVSSKSFQFASFSQFVGSISESAVQQEIAMQKLLDVASEAASNAPLTSAERALLEDDSAEAIDLESSSLSLEPTAFSEHCTLNLQLPTLFAY